MGYCTCTQEISKGKVAKSLKKKELNTNLFLIKQTINMIKVDSHLYKITEY